jgi:membrane protein DedA with SNARE-associated domain
MPIPEDLSLLCAGVLVRTGHADLLTAIVVGYLGVMLGDVVSWTYGRRLGLHPTGFIARLVGDEDIANIERFYKRYGHFAIVIARQFPGMRLPAFLFAGATGISLPRFLLIDGAAAVITVGVYITLGVTFGDDISRIVSVLDDFRLAVGAVVLTLVVLVAWRIISRRIRRKRASR